LASRLIAKSIDYGKDLDVDGTFVEATNIYLLSCFKQQNFKNFDELISADYNPERLVNLNDKTYDRCYLVA
jgi:hypothetical protein